MQCDCIIQARLGSTRFPQKIFSLLDGKPLLQYIIDHLKKSKKINRIIVATTNNSLDDQLCAYCEEQAIFYHRGSEENVLQRFIDTAHTYQCKDIVRLCSDNPFIDIAKLDDLISAYFIEPIDYCTYATSAGTPIILKPLGLFAEIVSYDALKKVASLAVEKKYFEHVTLFIYSYLNLFKIKKILLPEMNENYRFTIDYPEDLYFCNKVIEKIGNNINLATLLKLMETDQEMYEINVDFSKKHAKIY